MDTDVTDTDTDTDTDVTNVEDIMNEIDREKEEILKNVEMENNKNINKNHPSKYIREALVINTSSNSDSIDKEVIECISQDVGI
uniref:Serine-threonine kinase n=1 Tax=Ectromelia virus TaxID=12643 RepID=A0A8D9CEK9_9POXV|nr:serine-threonine kinase [Ectromelia virus]CAG7621682.1 serine-threonine kinase [Ectromelia virus]CAG7621712.1 serine-threonine kinase [Ectromelia virus]CAG7621752.1 serine-threonine kinase [Ectromelia virus]CAG7621796.1 serine-threonine kinase [Ectromelia virus]